MKYKCADKKDMKKMEDRIEKKDIKQDKKMMKPRAKKK